jgi:single-strand DNA-binding protein
MTAAYHTTTVGNLVDDPEVRFTHNGIAVANLRVAVTERIQQDGEWRDGNTSFALTAGVGGPSTWPTPWPRGTG